MGLLFVLFTLSLCTSAVIAQVSYGACYGGSSTCCFDIDFEHLPGYNLTLNATAGRLSQGELKSLPDTFAALGVKIWLDEHVVRPASDPPVLFPLGLMNSSTVAGGSRWAQLRSSTEGLVLAVLDTIDPLAPLRSSSEVPNPYTIHVSFASVLKSKAACVSSIRLLKTYDTAYRMGMDIKLMDSEGDLLGTRASTWTLVQKSSVADIDVSIPEVSFMDVGMIGYGYAAIASIRACYPSSSLDACGVCGGDGTVCGSPVNGTAKPGMVCVNNSMSNPVCRPGRYDQELLCVPNLLGISKEVCNGRDDDCDGVVDNGAPSIAVSCGIGMCNRTVYQCAANYTFNATCVPGDPVPEICDGLDNDCDGLIDEGDVCYQPVNGVPVVPVGVCVEGRLQALPRSQPCVARFGYFVKETHFNVTLNYSSDVNSVAFSAAAPSLWEPTIFETPPSFFFANAHSTNAFRVELPACSGSASSASWRLGDGNGNYLTATVDADTATPCETGNFTIQTALALPITPLMDEPCVRRANGNCSVRFGYFNPNTEVPTGYVDVGSPSNYLYITGGSAGANTVRKEVTGLPPTPNVFFPSRVRGAYVATWPCPTGQEALHWRLTSGTANVTREVIAKRICP